MHKMNNIYKQPMTDSLPPSKGGRSFFHFQYQHYLGVVSAEVCYVKLISCIPYCGKTYWELFLCMWHEDTMLNFNYPNQICSQKKQKNKKHSSGNICSLLQMALLNHTTGCSIIPGSRPHCGCNFTHKTDTWESCMSSQERTGGNNCLTH